MSELNLKLTQRHAELLRTACLRLAAHLGTQPCDSKEQAHTVDQDVRILSDLEVLLEDSTLRMAANAKQVKVTRSAGLNEAKARYKVFSPITSMSIIIEASRLQVTHATDLLGRIGLTYEQAGKVLCLIGSVNKKDAAQWLGLDYSVSSDI